MINQEKLTKLILEQQTYLKTSLNKRKSESFIDNLFQFLFNLETNICQCSYAIEQKLRFMNIELSEILFIYLRDSQKANYETCRFFESVEDIYLKLISDAKAMLENDPAAQNLEEVYKNTKRTRNRITK